ncbi:hypothetical protein SDC9_155941 [bioreactor metagenome]|uniref:Uncharacterized protein n=1 Tax=bioreactor metagenome TaxID=1076179 RepID=A0A645F4V0_9ZZZZ
MQGGQQLPYGVPACKGIDNHGFLPVGECIDTDALIFFYYFSRLFKNILLHLELLYLLLQPVPFFFQVVAFSPQLNLLF